MENFCTKLKSNGRPVKSDVCGLGLANSVIRSIYAHCKAALEKAVAEKLIRQNPAKFYYVDQNEMDLYRPSAEHNEEWQVMFYLILMCYDDGEYTKEVHEAVLAEEEAERLQKMNCNSVDGETK